MAASSSNIENITDLISTLEFEDDDALRASAEEYNRDGEAEMNKNELNSAIDFFTKGIQVNCNDDQLNATLYTNRATAHCNLGNYHETLSDAKTARQLKPTYMKAIERGAFACVKLCLFKEAINWCNEGLANDPDNMLLLETRNMSIKASRDTCTDDAKNKEASGQVEGKTTPFKNAGNQTFIYLSSKQDRDTAREGEMCASLANAYLLSGDFKKAIEYYQLHLAKEVDDKAGEGRVYGNLGTAYRRHGDYKNAIKYHQLALNIAKEVGDRAGEAHANGNLGNVYLSLREFEKAIEYHQLNRAIAKEVEDKGEEERAYINLGTAYESLGDYKKAIECHQLRLNIAKEVGDRVEEARANGKLGDAYLFLADFKNAKEYYELHLSIAKEVGNRAEEGCAYSNLGHSYHSLGQFKTAKEYHQLHLSIAKQLGDKDGEGRANANLGNCYHSLGEFETAKECHQLHLSIAKQLGDKVGEGRAYGNLGNAYESLGDAIKAIGYHQRRLSIAKELRDRAGEGNSYSNLGNAYLSLGGFKEALKYHEQHLSIAKELGDRAGEGRAYSNLGSDYYSVGNFVKAIECHELYLSVAKEIGDRDGEGRTYGSLGKTYRRLGDFKKAIEYHQRCLNIAKEVGDRAGEGGAHGNLGNVYLSLGDFTKAIECLQLCLGIAQEVGDRAGEGRAYANLGSAYLSLDKFEEAIECYSHRLIIAQERGNRHGEEIAYGNLGNAYESLGDFKTAIENHQLCLSIAKDVGDRSGEGDTYCNLGNVYHSLGDFKRAIECYQLCLSIAKGLGKRAGEAGAYCNLGHTYQSLGNLCQSESFYKSSVELYDDLRDRLQSNDEWKISLRDQYDEVYIGLMTVLLKQNKVAEALLTAERGRAQALMDLIKSQYDFDLALSQPVAKEIKIVETLSYITSQTVFVAVGTEELNFWVLEKGKDVQFRQKKIDKATSKKDVITTFHSLTSDAKQEIGVKRYIRCENRTLDELEPKVENPADKKSEEKRMTSYSRDSPLRILYEMIINPIVDLIQGHELTIVPDGPLFLAPFPAFLDHCSKFLCESFRIRLIPTLSTLKLLAESSQSYHSESKALLVGEPWVAEVRGKRLCELPFAKKEVEMIGKILNVSPLVGKEATKAEVTKRLSSAAIVHIAAHGKMETGEIALSPNHKRSSKFPKEEDYLLTMKDVSSVQLRARLVVLSCCHSGQGEIKAEGVVGIARAFLGAGARSVLVSLWAINDEATLEFMRCFYQHLVEGRSAGEAVNQARKCLKESETFSGVKHWAPFMLIGDDITLDFGRKA